MKHEKLTRLILASLFAALTCAATMLIHIPMPATNGYINLGDCVVLLSAFFLGPVYGMAAGGIGSMLADLLLGYAFYAPGTLIIKGLTALTASLILNTLHGKPGAMLVSAIAGEVIMVLGYFAYESLILGYGMAAAVSIPGNAIQGAVGIIVSIAAYKALRAIPYVRRLSV